MLLVYKLNNHETNKKIRTLHKLSKHVYTYQTIVLKSKTFGRQIVKILVLYSSHILRCVKVDVPN